MRVSASLQVVGHGVPADLLGSGDPIELFGAWCGAAAGGMPVVLLLVCGTDERANSFRVEVAGLIAEKIKEGSL